MMVRRLLEEICADAGAEGKDLFKRLEILKTKVTLPQELFEAMTELKALGNDAAHIDARSYRGRVGLSAENPFKDFALLFSANDIRLLG